jgi:hypothetical protein
MTEDNRIKIGIIDADLIGREKHRFPNLACEKISGYWKSQGAEVHLLMDYFFPSSYDHIYISKVFTDTEVPQIPEDDERIHIGGTGFFFDKAPNLPDEIEHHMPDYHLYDEWIADEVDRAEAEAAKVGKKFNRSAFMVQFKEYTDYSIGFITRGCFRKCKFCVNQKYDRVFMHSPLDEFYDPDRKKICLLDDNFFGCPQWKPALQELIDTGKPFKFKQGLDERLLTEEKSKMLFNSNYDGDLTFAFDNIADYELIHSKLKLIRKYAPTKSIKFYVLVGFESTGAEDIANAFKRIELLMRYKCLPYIMRYQDKNRTPWKESAYKGMYVSMARWGNQPSIFKKMSFRQFCEANQALFKSDGLCAPMRALTTFEQDNPEIASQYFDLRFDDYNSDD